MRSGESDAQARFPASDCRIANGGNKNALFAQFRRSFNGLAFIANQDGNYGARNLRIANCELRLKFSDPRPEMFSPVFAFAGLNKANGRRRSRSRCRERVRC